MFESGVKLFESDIKPASGQVYCKISVLYTDEKNVECCKEIPMAEFVRVRADNKTNCKGLWENLAVCMGVADILYV